MKDELRCEACNELLEPSFRTNKGKPVYEFLVDYPVCGRHECYEEIAQEHYPELRYKFLSYLQTEGLTQQDVSFGEWLEEGFKSFVCLAILRMNT